MATALLLIVGGFVIASIAMSIGIGGGIFWVPFLLALGLKNPAVVVPTALLIQVVGKGVGSVYNVLKQKEIDWKTVLITFIAGIIGVVIGSYLLYRTSLASNLPLFAEILGIIVFVVLSLVTGMIFSNASAPNEEGDRNLRWFSLSSALFSVATGAFGTGTDDYIVPVAQLISGEKSSKVIGSSIFSMWLLAIVAVLIHTLGFSGKINLTYFIWGGVGVVIGALFGSLVVRKWDIRIPRVLASVILLIEGIWLVLHF